MEGIALRYWHSGNVCIVEHVHDVKLAEDRTAKGLMSLAKTTLEDEHEISMELLEPFF